MPKLLADRKRKEVGCVLLQAAFDCPTDMAGSIDTDVWFLAPTDDMKVYDIPEEKVQEVIDGFNREAKKRREQASSLQGHRV